MLTENDVVLAVVKYLKKNGFEILSQATTIQRGIDIKAKDKKSEVHLFIEAKGATSSKPKTKRFGKPFNNNQIESHVSRAILKLMKITSNIPTNQKIKVAIALPDNEGHRKLIKKIYPSLTRLKIGVFWVKDNLKVENINFPKCTFSK